MIENTDTLSEEIKISKKPFYKGGCFIFGIIVLLALVGSISYLFLLLNNKLGEMKLDQPLPFFNEQVNEAQAIETIGKIKAIQYLFLGSGDQELLSGYTDTLIISEYEINNFLKYKDYVSNDENVILPLSFEYEYEEQGLKYTLSFSVDLAGLRTIDFNSGNVEFFASSYINGDRFNLIASFDIDVKNNIIVSTLKDVKLGNIIPPEDIVTEFSKINFAGELYQSTQTIGLIKNVIITDDDITFIF